jgi:TPP-dependent pyruvate/acetoin dehydrogenase alpha subunit
MSTAKQSTSKSYTLTAPAGLELDEQAYRTLYRFLKLTRLMDEKLLILYKQNRIVGGLYSGLGQEATAVGSAFALETDDYIAPLIRNMGTFFVRGFTALDLFLQYLAKAAGPSKGRENTLHFGSLEKKVIGPISLLGDMIPIMAGLGLALKNKGIPNVTMTYIGDGGSSTGAFHEGLNFAAVRKVPLILILENNGYAYSTPVARQANITDFADKARAYGIRGEIVDGNNVLAVYDAVRRARQHCLDGGGPVLIESKTFRRRGHAAHDDASYVSAEIKTEWEKKDPVEAFTRYIIDNAIIPDSELTGIEANISQEIETALEQALESPYPRPEDARGGVYFGDS